jgi:hypothetical protein
LTLKSRAAGYSVGGVGYLNVAERDCEQMIVARCCRKIVSRTILFMSEVAAVDSISSSVVPVDGFVSPF